MKKTLFLVDGASGPGKTDLIGRLSSRHIESTVVKKYTTRKKRKTETVKLMDLEYITRKQFNKRTFDYEYRYGTPDNTNEYGIYKKDIKNALRSYREVFVIVRNIGQIQKIQSDFSNMINIVIIYIYTDNHLIANRLKKEGLGKEDIRYRIRRLREAYNSYLENPFVYNEVILNSGDRERYGSLISGLIEEYHKKIHIDAKYIFVLMPFKKKYDNLLSEFKIATKAVDNKILIERASEEYGSYEVLHQIFHNIQKASLIICDLSDERPNVYLEAGYAIAIEKKIIFCIKKGTKKHFDLKGYKMIEYNNVTELKEKLIPEIKNHYAGDGYVK